MRLPSLRSPPLQPDNMLLTDERHVKLADLGAAMRVPTGAGDSFRVEQQLAQSAADAERDGEGGYAPLPDMHLVGTPAFASLS